MSYFRNLTLENVLKILLVTSLIFLSPVLAFSQQNHFLTIQIEDNFAYSIVAGESFVVPSSFIGESYAHGPFTEQMQVRLRIRATITDQSGVPYLTKEFKWFFKRLNQTQQTTVDLIVDEAGDSEHILSFDIPCYIKPGNYNLSIEILNRPFENCDENWFCSSSEGIDPSGIIDDCCLIYSGDGNVGNFDILLKNQNNETLRTILGGNDAPDFINLPYQQNIGTLNISGQGFDATLSTGATNFEGYTNISVNVSPVGAYTYLWDNGSTGATKHNACKGKDHSVTVTNTSGCSRMFTFDGELQMNLDGTSWFYNCVNQVPPFGNPGGGILIGDVFEIDIPTGGPKNFVIPVGGIGGNKLSNDNYSIIIKPNPVSNVLSVNLPSVEFNKGIFHLYALNGKEVMFHNINPGAEITNIDVSNINSGVYLLKIVADDKEIHTQKLTIAH